MFDNSFWGTAGGNWGTVTVGSGQPPVYGPWGPGYPPYGYGGYPPYGGANVAFGGDILTLLIVGVGIILVLKAMK
jgi:hypothetical protein